MPGGWAYLQVPDPGNGQYTLTGVVRSDGVQIYFNTNVWTTDRTFIGGGHPPIRENVLHLLDYGSTGAYTLYYQPPPTPDTTPPISAVAALPANSYPQINLSWQGSDNPGGSGIVFFDIFASVDGGPFSPWLPRATVTSSLYPGQLGHAYAFYSIATDAAGNRQSPPTQPDAQTFVSLTNSPPVILSATNITIDEGQTLSLTLPASDPDVGQTLTYTLGAGAPLGVNGPNSAGTLTWPTSELTGPSTNVFKVIVTDNGVPPLSATCMVTVVVREVNTAPILSPVASRTISEGDLLTITNHATDSDVPANTLTYALSATVPAGASINAANGVFTWQPNSTQGPSTNVFTVVVTDNGVPPLSDSQQFTVVVRDVLSDFSLTVGSTNLFGGENSSVPLVLNGPQPFTNLTFQLTASSSVITSLTLTPIGGEVVAASLSPSGGDRYSVAFVLNPDQQAGVVRPIASLDFGAVSNRHSAILLLTPQQLLASQSSGPVITNGAVVSGRIIVVNTEPVLDVGSGLPIDLTFYGKPGTNYSVLSYSSLLLDGLNMVTNITLTNRFITLPMPVTDAPAQFYRVRQE
jgi:hypothetical protein